ncbi:MAG: 50S ribosomal protein L30 [Nanoarchaeota archaeon]|nr:50S ribosomal protein L30 [Nanoarchaeota archaeon]|tara:strand:+ start:463 stop:939 length:477 start_codon:yes stop_codon:yes gene_type:complete
MESKRIAVIRIRGIVHIDKRIEDTFRKLRLFRKNGCVIINNKKDYLGMLNKIKDYSTWGEIDEETFKSLLLKRGRLPGNKALNEEYVKEKIKLGIDEFSKEFFEFKKELKTIPGLKSFFRLGMPRKGFGRKGIKVPYSLGGALGYRKEKINELISRML